VSIYRRLEKLEPPAKAAHQAAWERLWALETAHITPVWRVVRRAPEVIEAVTADDLTFASLWASLNVRPEPWEELFEQWDDLYSRAYVPSDATPDLGFWPDALPQPPDEPPGIWQRLEKHLAEPDRRVWAALTLTTLAIARALRDYRRGVTPENAFTGGSYRA